MNTVRLKIPRRSVLRLVTEGRESGDRGVQGLRVDDGGMQQVLRARAVPHGPRDRFSRLEECTQLLSHGTY